MLRKNSPRSGGNRNAFISCETDGKQVEKCSLISTARDSAWMMSGPVVTTWNTRFSGTNAWKTNKEIMNHIDFEWNFMITVSIPSWPPMQRGWVSLWPTSNRLPVLFVWCLRYWQPSTPPCHAEGALAVASARECWAPSPGILLGENLSWYYYNKSIKTYASRFQKILEFLCVSASCVLLLLGFSFFGIKFFDTKISPRIIFSGGAIFCRVTPCVLKFKGFAH